MVEVEVIDGLTDFLVPYLILFDFISIALS